MITKTAEFLQQGYNPSEMQYRTMDDRISKFREVAEQNKSDWKNVLQMSAGAGAGAGALGALITPGYKNNDFIKKIYRGSKYMAGGALLGTMIGSGLKYKNDRDIDMARQITGYTPVPKQINAM